MENTSSGGSINHPFGGAGCDLLVFLSASYHEPAELAAGSSRIEQVMRLVDEDCSSHQNFESGSKLSDAPQPETVPEVGGLICKHVGMIVQEVV